MPEKKSGMTKIYPKMTKIHPKGKVEMVGTTAKKGRRGTERKSMKRKRAGESPPPPQTRPGYG